MNKKQWNEKIYYIHGYLSSPDGDKGILFKKHLNAEAIKYRECEPEDLVISKCLQKISDAIQNDNTVSLIGSSLGGFLAASIALSHANVKKLILLNPAVIRPSTNVDSFVGVPQRILNDMKTSNLYEQRLTCEIIILRSTEDELIPDSWIYEFAKYHEAIVIFFHDDHRFSHNLTKLPLIISNLLKKKVLSKHPY
jgi:predicted esterase YcpF (UPF0227 family)